MEMERGMLSPAPTRLLCVHDRVHFDLVDQLCSNTLFLRNDRVGDARVEWHVQLLQRARDHREVLQDSARLLRVSELFDIDCEAELVEDLSEKVAIGAFDLKGGDVGWDLQIVVDPPR